MTIAAASSTNWADAMDFHAAMMCQDGHPALACCALDGTLRTSTSNRCSLSCSSRCFQRCPACSCSWNTATTRSGRWWRLHYNISCTRLVKWTPRVPASPALPALPHTQYTHTITQSPPRQPSRRRAARLGRSGAAGDGRQRVRRVQRTPAWAAAGPRDFAGPTDLAAADRQQGCSAIRPWERPPEAAVPYEPSGPGSRNPDADARQALGRAAVRRAPA